MSDKPVWYLIMTNPRCEGRVEEGLRDLGIDCYVPRYMMRSLNRRTRKPQDLVRTLFPRYLFAKQCEGAWLAISAIDGVESVVREFGRHGAPARIHEGIINRLMQRQEDGDFDDLPRKAERYKIGQHVRVSAGSIANFSGFIERLRGSAAVDILLPFFGKDVLVTLPVAQITAV